MDFAALKKHPPPHSPPSPGAVDPEFNCTEEFFFAASVPSDR